MQYQLPKDPRTQFDLLYTIFQRKQKQLFQLLLLFEERANLENLYATRLENISYGMKSLFPKGMGKLTMVQSYQSIKAQQSKQLYHCIQTEIVQSINVKLHEMTLSGEKTIKKAEQKCIQLGDMMKQMDTVRFEFASNFRLSIAAQEKMKILNSSQQQLPILQKFRLSVEIYDYLQEGDKARSNMNALTLRYNQFTEYFLKEYVIITLTFLNQQKDQILSEFKSYEIQRMELIDNLVKKQIIYDCENTKNLQYDIDKIVNKQASLEKESTDELGYNLQRPNLKMLNLNEYKQFLIEQFEQEKFSGRYEKNLALSRKKPTSNSLNSTFNFFSKFTNTKGFFSFIDTQEEKYWCEVILNMVIKKQLLTQKTLKYVKKIFKNKKALSLFYQTLVQYRADYGDISDLRTLTNFRTIWHYLFSLTAETKKNFNIIVDFINLSRNYRFNIFQEVVIEQEDKQEEQHVTKVINAQLDENIEEPTLIDVSDVLYKPETNEGILFNIISQHAIFSDIQFWETFMFNTIKRLIDQLRIGQVERKVDVLQEQEQKSISAEYDKIIVQTLKEFSKLIFQSSLIQEVAINFMKKVQQSFGFSKQEDKKPEVEFKVEVEEPKVQVEEVKVESKVRNEEPQVESKVEDIESKVKDDQKVDSNILLFKNALERKKKVETDLTKEVKKEEENQSKNEDSSDDQNEEFESFD